MTEREAIYLINRMESVGSAGYERLVQWYGSAAAAWQERTVPLSDKQREEWELFHRSGKETAFLRELEELPSRGIRFLERGEEDFPESLLWIAAPPVGLYLKGKLPNPGTDLVAMVGARRCSEYGRTTAQALGEALAREGIAVVSGMAMGIDAWSQWGALAGGGTSVAVLGSGIDQCYPPSNRRLYERLVAEGAVLSEYGPGVPGVPYHFPLRNRLISGLSRVVLVLEARERSGSLITADLALEQGRDVLALPGRIGDPLSQGCNQLIRQGAGILTGVSDVLLALGRQDAAAEEAERRAADPLEGLPEAAAKVYEQIGSEPVHPEFLGRQCGIPLSGLFGLLWELECRGLIRPCTPGTYIRVPRAAAGRDAKEK